VGVAAPSSIVLISHRTQLNPPFLPGDAFYLFLFIAIIVAALTGIL
jgi:hypothetical protein